MDIRVTLNDQPRTGEESSDFSALPKLAEDDPFAIFPTLYRWLIKIAIVILGGLIVFLGVMTILALDWRAWFAGLLLV